MLIKWFTQHKDLSL